MNSENAEHEVYYDDEDAGPDAQLLPPSSSTSSRNVDANGIVFTPSKTDSSPYTDSAHPHTSTQHHRSSRTGARHLKSPYAEEPGSPDPHAPHAHASHPSTHHEPGYRSATHHLADPSPPARASRTSKILFAASVIIFCLALLVLGQAAWMEEQKIKAWCYRPNQLQHGAGAGSGSGKGEGDVPEYFDWEKQDYRGVREDGRVPMLAEERWVAGLGSEGGWGGLGGPSHLRDLPGELGWGVDELIEGREEGDRSIWSLMGHLSPWGRAEEGFGVEEMGLPEGAKVKQMHLLHRHGARYPTGNSPIKEWGMLVHAGKTGGFTGNLSFLNNWTYDLGGEILVPFGRQQLFTSGMSHHYRYGRLYDSNTKIVARTTTQDRMIDSAIHFLAGFFGPNWPLNVTLETIIESSDFNNSLAGYDNCPNANHPGSDYGTQASKRWQEIYLANATQRLQALSPSVPNSDANLTWTPHLLFSLQQLCPYETIAQGFSHFCTLFTYKEWLGFEYAIDLQFHGDAMFGSPTGRAVGSGWVHELLARLKNETITTARGQVNVTLDEREETFPLGQGLYLDFSHDTNIAAVLAAMGLTQFSGAGAVDGKGDGGGEGGSPAMPAEGPPDPHRGVIVSQLTPFAARLGIEVIEAPRPVKSGRLAGAEEEEVVYEEKGEKTTYVHLLLNSRTVPLGNSWEECGQRTDGWCEFGTFVDRLGKEVEKARFEESCFREVKKGGGEYGDVEDGVPVG